MSQQPQAVPQPAVHYVFPLSEAGLLAILEDDKVPEEIRGKAWAPISRSVPTTYIDKDEFRKFMAWADIISEFVMMSVPDYDVSFDDVLYKENLMFYVAMQLKKAQEGFFWRVLKPQAEVKRSLLDKLFGKRRQP